MKRRTTSQSNVTFEKHTFKKWSWVKFHPVCWFNLKREAVIKPIANESKSILLWSMYFPRFVFGVKFSNPWEELMYLMMKAWKQKAFDFCCWTSTQTPKWYHCLLLPASPQMMVVVELKWFTPHFSISKINLIIWLLHLESKSVLMVRTTRHNPARKIFSWKSSKLYSTFQDKNYNRSVFTLKFLFCCIQVYIFLIIKSNKERHQKKKSNQNPNKVSQSSTNT